MSVKLVFKKEDLNYLTKKIPPHIAKYFPNILIIQQLSFQKNVLHFNWIWPIKKSNSNSTGRGQVNYAAILVLSF